MGSARIEVFILVQNSSGFNLCPFCEPCYGNIMWLEGTRRDEFLSALIQRRQVYDQRLKGQDIRDQYHALHRNIIKVHSQWCLLRHFHYARVLI
jgi:hypothetical protein